MINNCSRSLNLFFKVARSFRHQLIFPLSCVICARKKTFTYFTYVPWPETTFLSQTRLSKQKVSISLQRVSIPLERRCSCEHIEKLRADLRNLSVVSQSSRSSEREVRRERPPLQSIFYIKLSFLPREKEGKREQGDAREATLAARTSSFSSKRMRITENRS